ncbi:MAG: BrnT family toxin [Synergistaceae bacterium]|nr:BrnT family toxin [Synergistaceae bacterium]
MKYIENEEIKLELGGMLFTWDDEKERINIRKHKLDFASAASVFMDTYLFTESNSVDEYTGEERFDAIGAIGGQRLIFVVYVERVTTDDDDIIRIISARRAIKEERIKYVNGN